MNPDFSKDVIALNDAGFEQISVEPVVLTPDSPYALRPDQLPMLKEQYEELGQEYIRRRAAGHFINFFHFNVDLEGGPCIRKRLSGCGSGDEYVAVTPEGDIYPCHQFVGREGYKMGSVLDGSFDTTIQNRFAANHVPEQGKVPLLLGALLLLGRLCSQRSAPQRRHLQALRHGMRAGAQASRMRDSGLRHRAREPFEGKGAGGEVTKAGRVLLFSRRARKRRIVSQWYCSPA